MQVAPRPPDGAGRGLRFSLNWTPTRPSPLSLVPEDILLEIASYLNSPADLFHFSSGSMRLYECIVPALYAAVTLVGVKQCTTTLQMLHRRPDIARHVQKLLVRPHTGRNGSRLRDDCIVAAAVRRTAIRLDALHHFVWDGDDMCPYDDMWFGLRMLCPQLRYIGTAVGLHVPGVNSHLFDFSGLVGFSITLRPKFYHEHVDRFANDEIPAYHKFWDMLINRCPYLEELSIEGTYGNPADAAMLIEGRWPRLRKLYLGDVVCDWLAVVPPNPTVKRPFIEFLENHPSLQSLSLSRHAINPGHFSLLDPAALPSMTSFEGTLDQLKALSFVHSSLKSVTFRDPMPTRELAPFAVAGMLQGFTSLSKLRIVFIVHSMYDSGGLLRSLVLSCPNLRHLDLTFACKSSIHLDSFAKAIRALTKLETLALAMVRSPGEETISAGACHIARTNHGLRHFRLTFLPPSLHVARASALPLQFSLPPAEESGDYTLHRDEHGIPTSLVVFERKARHWPLGLRVSHSVRRYVLDLRPAGHPGTGKRGLSGAMSLVLDAGKAGEEFRMLVFCAAITFVSVFGFIRGVMAAEVASLRPA